MSGDFVSSFGINVCRKIFWNTHITGNHYDFLFSINTVRFFTD